MTAQGDPAGAPSLGNAVVGVVGIGARAAAAGTARTADLAGAAVRPAAAATRALASPLSGAVRDELRPVLERLDAAGRRDLERARARLGRALDDSFDRALGDALGSPRTKRAVERLLESEELWLLVDRIANSAEVLDAITSTSVGLAGEVADEARRRTAIADDVAERIARRLLRRAPRPREPSRDELTVAEPVTPPR